MKSLSIIFLFVLLTACAGNEKKVEEKPAAPAAPDVRYQAAETIYEAIYGGVLIKLDSLLLQDEANSGLPSSDQLIPAEISPKALFQLDEMTHEVQKTIAEGLTVKQAEDLQALFSTQLGKILLEVVEISIIDGKFSQKKFAQALSQHDHKALMQEVEAVTSLDDINSANIAIIGSGKKMRSVASDFMARKIREYYAAKPFDSQDAARCHQLTQKTRNVYYAFYVCELGHRAGHFASSVNLASLYWQGRTIHKQRDVHSAKEILRSLLDRDTGGHAHYYLGMLIKNSPTESENLSMSYCLIKKSQRLGNTQAQQELKELHDSGVRHNC